MFLFKIYKSIICMIIEEILKLIVGAVVGVALSMKLKCMEG